MNLQWKGRQWCRPETTKDTLMAIFFKYKTAEELLAENTRLGINLRLSKDLSVFNQPLAIGSRTVGNRWCIQPMEGCDGDLDGRPGELTFRRYHRFGAGGAKLIWGEACAVLPEARATPRQIMLNNHTRDDFARMVDECRQSHCAEYGGDSDLLIGLQLTHSGRYSHLRPLLARRDILLDARTRPDKASVPGLPAEYPLLSDDELQALVDVYARSAKLAQVVGFDFVDVKQCHGYLLQELLGARNRPGRFGGCFENRTRLAREIFQSVHTAAPNLILASRLGVYDSVPFHKGPDDRGVIDPWSAPLAAGWGMSESDPAKPDLSEPLRWVAEMRQLGVALVNVTLGNPYTAPHFVRPFEYPPLDGYGSPEHPLIGVDRHFRLTAMVQRSFPDLPIVGTGYSYLQEFLPQAGAANLRDGAVSLVGLGRASLAQPDLPMQLARHGMPDRKRICRTFSYCTALMRSKDHPMGQYPAGCPPFDKEAYGAIWQEILQLGRRK